MIVTVDDMLAGGYGVKDELLKLQTEHNFPMDIKMMEIGGTGDYIGQHLHREIDHETFNQFHYFDTIKQVPVQHFDKTSGNLKPEQDELLPLTGGRGKNAQKKRYHIYEFFRSLLGKTSFCWSAPWFNFDNSAASTVEQGNVKESNDTIKRLNKVVDELQTRRDAPITKPLAHGTPLAIYCYTD